MNEEKEKLTTKALINDGYPDGSPALVSYEPSLSVGVVVTPDSNIIKLFYELNGLTEHMLRPYWSFGTTDEEYANKIDYRKEEAEYEMNMFMATLACLFSKSLKTKFGEWREPIKEILNKQAVDEFLEYGELKERMPQFGLRYDIMTDDQIERTEGCPRLEKDQLKAISSLWKVYVSKRVSIIREFILSLFIEIANKGVEYAFDNFARVNCNNYTNKLKVLMEDFKNKFNALRGQPFWTNDMKKWYDAIVRSCGNKKFDKLLELKRKLRDVQFGNIVKCLNAWLAVSKQGDIAKDADELLGIAGVKAELQKAIENELDYRLREHNTDTGKTFVTGKDDDMIKLIMKIYNFEGSAYHDFIMHLVDIYIADLRNDNTVYTTVLTNIIKAMNLYLAIYTYKMQGIENKEFEHLLPDNWKEEFENVNSIRSRYDLHEISEKWSKKMNKFNNGSEDEFLRYRIEIIIFINPGDDMRVAEMKNVIKEWIDGSVGMHATLSLIRYVALVSDVHVTKSVARNAILQQATGCYVTMCDAHDLPTSIFNTIRILDIIDARERLSGQRIMRSIAGFYHSPRGKDLGCNGYIIVRPAWICNSWGWCPWIEDDEGVSAERLISIDHRRNEVGPKILNTIDEFGVASFGQMGGPYERLRDVQKMTETEELLYSKWTDYWTEVVLNKKLRIDPALIEGVTDKIKTHIDKIVCATLIGEQKEGNGYNEIKETKVWLFAGIRYNRRARIEPNDFVKNENEQIMTISDFNTQLKNEIFYGGEYVFDEHLPSLGQEDTNFEYQQVYGVDVNDDGVSNGNNFGYNGTATYEQMNEPYEKRRRLFNKWVIMLFVGIVLASIVAVAVYILRYKTNIFNRHNENVDEDKNNDAPVETYMMYAN